MKNIVVAGNIIDDAQRILKVSEYIKNKYPEFSVLNGINELRQILLQAESNWMDISFEYILNSIEMADAVVLVSGGDNCTTSWVLGYAFSLGIPVIVATARDEDFPLSVLGIKSFHAHIRSWQELEEYDFNEMPANFFRGQLIQMQVEGKVIPLFKRA
ncbi:hypothetical protein V7128_07510 [Neobacillus vireti]|uniref:hypothetical protein n=1 Tax=Neobacillus vireti TaxID=220686 RepID=UPI002FFEF787